MSILQSIGLAITIFMTLMLMNDWVVERESSVILGLMVSISWAAFVFFVSN